MVARSMYVAVAISGTSSTTTTLIPTAAGGRGMSRRSGPGKIEVDISPGTRRRTGGGRRGGRHGRGAPHAKRGRLAERVVGRRLTGLRGGRSSVGRSVGRARRPPAKRGLRPFASRALALHSLAKRGPRRPLAKRGRWDGRTAGRRLTGRSSGRSSIWRSVGRTRSPSAKRGFRPLAKRGKSPLSSGGRRS